jgi:hypothetical protein
MMFESWQSVAAMAAVVAVLLTLVSIVTAWAVRVSNGERADKSAEKAHERIDSVVKELSDFKAHVAEKYVTGSVIEQLENRLIDAINRLGDRLDRFLERNTD